MATNLRDKAHQTVDQLSETQLQGVLRFMELLMTTAEDSDIEPEEIWLLETGALKRMVDEIEDAPPPVDDWQTYLHAI